MQHWRHVVQADGYLRIVQTIDAAEFAFVNVPLSNIDVQSFHKLKPVLVLKQIKLHKLIRLIGIQRQRFH